MRNIVVALVRHRLVTGMIAGTVAMDVVVEARRVVIKL